MDKNQIEYLYIDDANAEVGIVDGDILIKNKDDKVVASLSGKKELIEYDKSIPTSTNSYEIANTKFVQETIINNSIPVDKNSIPADTDLNNYTKTGVYFQNMNTFAASGKNYPAPLAGMLEVFNANNMLYQKYTTYAASNLTKNDYSVTYTRGFYSTDWSPWKKQANLSDDQIFTGTNIFSDSVSIKKDNGQNNLQLLNSENNGFQFYSTTASASNMGTLRYISGSDTIDFRFEGTTKSITYKNSEIANIKYVSSEIAKIPTPDLSIYLKKSEISDKSLSGNFKSLQVMDSAVALYGDLTKYAMLSGATFTGKVNGISFNSITGLSDKKPIMDGIASEGTSTLVARQDHIHPIDTSRAPIDSPKFKGTPTTPTPTIGTDTTQVANIKFVQEYIDDYSIPIDTKTSISAKDLNDFVNTGIFFSNTATAGSKNFPITLPGMLEVHKLDNMVFQRYTIYSASTIIKNESNDVYTRGYYEPTKTWSAWKKQANLTDSQTFIGDNSWTGLNNFTVSPTVPTPAIIDKSKQVANMAAINQAVTGNAGIDVSTAVGGVLTVTEAQVRLQWLSFSGTLTSDLIIEFPSVGGKTIALSNNVVMGNYNITLRMIGYTTSFNLYNGVSYWILALSSLARLSSLSGVNIYGDSYYKYDITTNDNSYRLANTAFVQNAIKENGIPVNKTSIPAKADLNDYSTTGIYFQGTTASAADGINYPAPLAGMLEVFKLGNMLYQRYTVYSSNTVTNNSYDVIYIRGFYSTGWSPWKKQANLSDDQDFTGINTVPTPVITDKSKQIANMAAINQAVTGYASIDVSTAVDGVLTITEAQYRLQWLGFTGTLTSDLIIDIPSGLGKTIALSNLVTMGNYSMNVRRVGYSTVRPLPSGTSLWLLNGSSGISYLSALYNASLTGNSYYNYDITTNDNSYRLANTAFVQNISALMGKLSANNTWTGQNTFTNVTKVPTISGTTDSSTNAASTSFVQQVAALKVNITNLSDKSLSIDAKSLKVNGTDVLTSHQDLSTYAKLASPTFTGIPAAPTAAKGTNTTQLATTSFVKTELGDYLTSTSVTNKSIDGNFKSLKVNDVNVLTSHQSLAEYAKITSLSDKSLNVNFKTAKINNDEVALKKDIPTVPDVSGFVKKSELSDKSLDGNFKSLKINDSEVALSSSLSDYVKTASLSNKSLNIDAKTLKVNGTDVLTSHQSLSAYAKISSLSDKTIDGNFKSLKVNDVNVLTSHQDLSAYAKLASPVFTGTPTAPTAARTVTTNQLANMTAVNQAVTGYVNLNVSAAVSGVLTITEDQARAQWINIQGTLTGNIIIEFPTTIVKNYHIYVATTAMDTYIISARNGSTGSSNKMYAGMNLLSTSGGTNMYRIVALTGVTLYDNSYYNYNIATNDNSYRLANTAFVQGVGNLCGKLSANNTWTGQNTFNSTVKVPTISGTTDSSTNAASTAFVQNISALMGKLGGNNVWTGSNTFNQISISEFTSILNNEKKGWQFFASSSGNKNISTLRYLGKDNFNIDLTFDSDAKMFNLHGTNIRLTGDTSVSKSLTVENFLKSKFKCGPGDALILSNENNIGFYFSPTRAEGSSTESINGGTLSHYNPNTGKATSLYFDGLNDKVKYHGYELATIRKSAGEYWIQSNINSDDFKVIYYKNSVWVAGSGSSLGLYYSSDCKIWYRSNITLGIFYSIYYGNGIWVAGSSRGLYFSYDGKNWDQGNIVVNSFYSVYYANDIWVACNQTSSYYSSDGVIWYRSDITSGIFYSVYYGNGIWVIASSHGLFYSSDGKTWYQSNIAAGDFHALHYDNNIWISATYLNNGGLYYSLDGKTWYQSNITTGFNSVYYGNNTWVAANYNSGLYYSLDGKTWYQSNITTGTFKSPYYGNNIWVTGSGNDLGLYYSLDGKIWKQSNINSQFFDSVHYGNDIFAASSISNGLYYSENIIGMFFIGIFDEILANKKFTSLLKDEDIITINKLNSQFKNMIDNDEQVSLDDIPDNIYHIINEFLLFDDIESSMSQLVKYTIPFYSSEFSESENEQLITYLNECRLKLRMFETHELGSGINLQVPEKTNFINILLNEGFI